MKPIIRVENLSKQYRIGAQQASYSTLRDSISNAVTAPFRRIKNLTNLTDHRPPTTDPKQSGRSKTSTLKSTPAKSSASSDATAQANLPY